MFEHKMDSLMYGKYLETLFARHDEEEMTIRKVRADKRRLRVLNEKFEIENARGLATAGTVWAGYNAVVDYLDHVTGKRVGMQSTLFGAVAAQKRNAFDAALALVS